VGKSWEKNGSQIHESAYYTKTSRGTEVKSYWNSCLAPALQRGDPFSGRNERSENEISQGKDYVEVVKMSLVMHVMMGIQPAEPRAPLNPAFLRHMHAEMEILVEEVIETHRSHSAKENIYLEKMLDPENHGRMQPENQRRIPPSEPYLFEILVLQKKIGWTRTEDTVMDQGMRAKRIRPDGLVHQKPMQEPFKKTGIEKER
jgi:hypothetical protein